MVHDKGSVFRVLPVLTLPSPIMLLVLSSVCTHLLAGFSLIALIQQARQPIMCLAERSVSVTQKCIIYGGHIDCHVYGDWSGSHHNGST